MSRFFRCPLGDYPCSTGEELPGTLSDLKSRTSLDMIGHGLEALALIGTQFEDALITTRNGGALISGRGGYCAFQGVDSPWRLSPQRVTIRVATEGNVRLARSAVSPSMPGSLVAADSAGKIVHRVQYSSDNDRLVAESLEPRSANEPKLLETEHTAPNVLSLGAIRAARADWESADTAMHLNDLLGADCGRARNQCLPHIGKHRAWRISVHVIPSFLGHLCENAVRYVPIVLGAGILQAGIGAVHQILRRDTIIIASGDAGLFSMDLNEVESAWVVVLGKKRQIEFYGHDRSAIAAITCDPAGDAAAWRELLASLPRPG